MTFPHVEPRAPRPWRDEAQDDHHRATLAAEIRRLQTSLWSFGPMPQVTLAHMVRAERWRGGSFEEALREGVRQGKLERMPFGWVKATQP